jgi:hypothetical protein
MRTHVIQLEPQDDLASIRDKMSWAKAPRILLVWSSRRRRLRLDEIQLTLLRRHAASLGAEAGLVTTQRRLRRMAEQAGIPAYRTIAEAQRAALLVPEPQLPRLAPVRSPGGEHPGAAELRKWHEEHLGSMRGEGAGWTSKRAVRIGFFVLGLGSLLALGLIFVPTANIQLSPLTQTQSLIVPVTASPHVTTLGLSGVVPARAMSLSLSDSNTLPASGSLLVPTASARGTVTLTNLTDGSISVPDGTALIAEGQSRLRLVTTAEVEVPAGPGETVDVGVRALQPGEMGNLAANAQLAFEGPLGLSLTAANAEPLTGGADGRQRSPTEGDRSKLYSVLSASLARKALAQAEATGEVIFPDTLVVLRTSAEDYAPSQGQAGAKLTLDLGQDFQLYYADQKDLEALGRAALDATLPPGYEAASGNISLAPISEPVTDSSGLTHWQVRASRTIRAAITPDDVIAQVRGRSLASARLALASLMLKSAPLIQVRPGWFPLLPLIPFQISVDTSS